MVVREYIPADLPALARVHRDSRRLPQIITGGGWAWVAVAGEQPIAYAAAVPLPGLEGIVDLQGYVALSYRRQGVGSHLLQVVLDGLAQAEVRQVAQCVESLSSPAACFLRHHDFYLEHEEWQMELSAQEMPAAPTLAPGYRLQTFTRTAAIRYFRALYESSFKGLPWYQPYTTAAEVASELDEATDLLFLTYRGEPVGFAWARLHGQGVSEIEPVGLIPSFQGRGLGRALLLIALHRLRHRGVQEIRLGVWRTNAAALRCYEGTGFRRRSSLYFLARDLP